jgi:copper chaperone
VTQELKYGVTGMTCDHCVKSVTEEVSALAGVSEVKINLIEGSQSVMTVTAENELDLASVQAAVSEAGDYAATRL